MGKKEELDKITQAIIRAAIQVHKALGTGFSLLLPCLFSVFSVVKH
jgi:hypothetical protein